MARAFSDLMSTVLGRIRKMTVPAKRRPAATTTTTTNTRSPSAPSSDTTLAGVTMEYKPDLDGDADPGEVVWTWVPWEEDPTQGKDRPVIVIGRRGPMLVGVPLTSKQHDSEPQVPIGSGPWDREGRQSYAKLDRVLDIDPAQVRREGAVLDRRHFDDVVSALRARSRR